MEWLLYYLIIEWLVCCSNCFLEGFNIKLAQIQLELRNHSPEQNNGQVYSNFLIYLFMNITRTVQWEFKQTKVNYYLKVGNNILY